MKLGPILKVALRALGKNKTRSLLTMLGIVIGVSAVIAMVSIGQGAQTLVQDQMDSLGTNILFLRPGSPTSGGARLGAGEASTLTDEDVAAIEREVPFVKAASPVVNASGQIVFGNQNWFASIQGTNERFPAIRKWDVAEGEFFTTADVRSAARVVVLGQTISENLFLGGDPVGQTVRIRNLPYRVVGVLSEKGQDMMGRDQDDTLVMPYTTVQKKLLGQTILSINQAMISAVSSETSALAETQITDLLRQRHRIPVGQPADFTVRNMSDIAEAAGETSEVMTLLLGSIAAVSLLVGGIGIMNIMLVSVTERTREIGIRMAIGARSGYVRMQFLAESVILSMFGGLVGVLAGGVLAVGVAKFLGWPTLVSPSAALLSFGFAAAVGIFFGYYPAHKAASLDPIEALRHE